MSARAIPVAARLSRHHLRLMRRARDGWIEVWIPSDVRRAERLYPAFLEVRRVGGKAFSAHTTDEGRAELARRGL